MQFEYVETVGRFLELEREWEELESRCVCHLFQNYRFLRSWLETASRYTNDRPAVVLYWEEGILRAIFPGCLTKRKGIPVVTWLGGFHVIDYGDILFDDSGRLPLADFIGGALELLKKQAGLRVCFLHNVREDALVYPYLQAHFLPCGETVAPFIRISGDFEPYFDSLKVLRKNMKSDTLRQIKRLSALGTLEFRVVERYDPMLNQIVREFLEQKERRLREIGGAGVGILPYYDDFLFAEVNENPYAHVSYIALNGEIIAVHIGYIYKNRRMYYYMPSFDSDLATYSPGRVLTYYLVEDCFTNGVEIFDLTIGAEAYKYHWTRDEVHLTSFVGNGARGRAFRYLVQSRKGRLLSPIRRLRSQHRMAPPSETGSY
ncbi:MAG: protein involved in cellulose biosynthesis (CelD)-like protein [Bryobacterales bacterium]|nr:protein involved in cellulose biosynthesis (CelD)-like protein [Bryobacterales bacterium]